MYKTGEKYTNRYGVEYEFVKIDENRVLFDMDSESLSYCRLGGFDYQEGVDWDNLSYFDPAGGPMIGVETEIDGRKVVRVSSAEDSFVLELAE